ncbi:hypothetical protein CONLIGDRAFT_21718 [Coniochaeta ligniaria NRRL 30616]|uniref:Uncharacterized protein n=1 Tax=Coniochaeta ligniaria NRRL 30616 TaxID=1408157 RepID=A0A1J7J3V6_9PEZI|nr:hypothetical protein CONLIGDRAFT_21718 [Coniochaeta ligniaria NRRL 30616]
MSDLSRFKLSFPVKRSPSETPHSGVIATAPCSAAAVSDRSRQRLEEAARRLFFVTSHQLWAACGCIYSPCYARSSSRSSRGIRDLQLPRHTNTRSTAEGRRQTRRTCGGNQRKSFPSQTRGLWTVEVPPCTSQDEFQGLVGSDQRQTTNQRLSGSNPRFRAQAPSQYMAISSTSRRLVHTRFAPKPSTSAQVAQLFQQEAGVTRP